MDNYSKRIHFLKGLLEAKRMVRIRYAFNTDVRVLSQFNSVVIYIF